MTSSSIRRCPTITTPRSFKSSAVKRGRTFSYCVLAECRLVLFEAQAPQPTSEVHDSARTQPHPGKTGCPAPLFIDAGRNICDLSRPSRGLGYIVPVALIERESGQRVKRPWPNPFFPLVPVLAASCTDTPVVLNITVTSHENGGGVPSKGGRVSCLSAPLR